MVMPSDVVALPESFNLHSLEAFNENRFRFRGKLLTQSIVDFAMYVDNRSCDSIDYATFINAEEMQARTVLNLGDDSDPGHGDHQAFLKLDKTGQYKALTAIDGYKQSQAAIAEWLEDWIPNLKAFDAQMNEIAMPRAIAAVRRLTIEAIRKEEHSTDDFKQSMTAMEAIEAKSKDVQPAFFSFECIPFHGLSSYTFKLRLSINTNEKPTFTLRIVRHETMIEAFTNEFKEILIERLPKGSEIYLGTFTL
jgi:uncharacterized protein YfdQ (DUF2303 family)